MKLICHCGELILDQTDYLPHKAHIIPDQNWFDVLDAIDAAIEKSGPTGAEKSEACMTVRKLISRVSRWAWQCRACGRVYIDDQGHEPRQLVPADGDVPRNLFHSRPEP